MPLCVDITLRQKVLIEITNMGPEEDDITSP